MVHDFYINVTTCCLLGLYASVKLILKENHDQYIIKYYFHTMLPGCIKEY